MRFRNVLEVDYIRRMDLEKSLVGADAFKRLDRAAAFVGRAVFAIDIIVVFVVLKIEHVARAEGDIAFGRVEGECLRFRKALFYCLVECGGQFFFKMKLAQKAEGAVSEGLINIIIISRNEYDEGFRILFGYFRSEIKARDLWHIYIEEDNVEIHLLHKRENKLGRSEGGTDLEIKIALIFRGKRGQLVGQRRGKARIVIADNYSDHVFTPLC